MIALNLTHAPKLNLEPSHLKDFLERIHQRAQGFYRCIDDGALLKDLQSFVITNYQVQDIVILGIGGSALGPRAIQDALRPLFNRPKPHLHVIDNVDPRLLSELEDHINFETTLFVVISKSGGTPEALSQYFYFRDKTDQAGLNAKDHFVFITDPQKGILRDIHHQEGIRAFDIPSSVGGRFSVLTAVGLLPACLMGMDIDKMIEGAQKVRDQFLSEKVEDNICYHLACLQYHWYKQGKSNVVFMPYKAHLRTVGDWYAQLLAESTGKIDRAGKNVGMTPIVATGVTDQHSQLQLYAQGPDDKQFIFVHLTDEDHGQMIPAPQEYEKTAVLSGVSFGELLQTEYQATATSLAELGRESLTLDINAVDETVLGEIFMLFQGATAFLGEFLDIDAFDQPGVERSKVLTRQYLMKDD